MTDSESELWNWEYSCWTCFGPFKASKVSLIIRRYFFYMRYIGGLITSEHNFKSYISSQMRKWRWRTIEENFSCYFITISYLTIYTIRISPSEFIMSVTPPMDMYKPRIKSSICTNYIFGFIV